MQMWMGNPEGIGWDGERMTDPSVSSLSNRVTVCRFASSRFGTAAVPSRLATGSGPHFPWL